MSSQGGQTDGFDNYTIEPKASDERGRAAIQRFVENDRTMDGKSKSELSAADDREQPKILE
jgi:hypothetical protein